MLLPAVAFNSVRRFGKGLAYFPALSLSHGEHCTLNFGATPFQHPVEGFRPLQDPPAPSISAKVWPWEVGNLWVMRLYTCKTDCTCCSSERIHSTA